MLRICDSDIGVNKYVDENVIRIYYKTSRSLIMLGWGESLRKAWISLKFITYRNYKNRRSNNTCSIESKWFFMHLIATYFPVLIDWAFRTSENVPSPFFEINLYSKKYQNTIK